MKYVAAYLLANLGGNASPSAKDLEKILGAGGLDVDMENVNAVVNALKGKNVEEVIASGQSKLASVPSGGGAAPAAAVSTTAAAPAAAEAPAKKEEKKEESEDEDMGFGLFEISHFHILLHFTKVHHLRMLGVQRGYGRCGSLTT